MSNYTQVILSNHLSKLKAMQNASADYHEIERLQENIDEVTNDLEIIIQHKQNA